MKVYINGKLLPERSAKISVFDHGLLYGDGVFEGIRTYDGKVSLLTARCLGACSLAPAAIIDGDVKGKVNAGELVAQLEAM